MSRKSFLLVTNQKLCLHACLSHCSLPNTICARLYHRPMSVNQIQSSNCYSKVQTPQNGLYYSSIVWLSKSIRNKLETSYQLYPRSAPNMAKIHLFGYYKTVWHNETSIVSIVPCSQQIQYHILLHTIFTRKLVRLSLFLCTHLYQQTWWTRCGYTTAPTTKNMERKINKILHTEREKEHRTPNKYWLLKCPSITSRSDVAPRS